MTKTKFQEELIHIQNEYKTLLERGLNEWEDVYFVEFIEEVNLFWKQNEPVLLNIYEYEFPQIDTVFLTAVTKIDLEYMQHYSMKITGSVCLIDDPLISYLNLLNREIPKRMREKLASVAQANINESLKLIENCPNDFFILPIRTIIPNDLINKASKQFFVSLFNDISDTEDYFKKIKTFNDIEQNLKDVVKTWILFGWDDDGYHNGSLKERFDDFVKAEYIGNKNSTAGEIFFFSQIGYISQSMNILFTMMELNFVPYVRGTIPFRYLTILYTSLKENLNLNLDIQIVRTSISYFFERVFDYNLVSEISYNEYLEKINGLSLYKYVEDALSLFNKELDEISLRQIDLTVEQFYKKEFLVRLK
ncbi:hypothetical protein [Alkalibacillus haloalkaliphilus]|uniref:Uncharacterized protein n=1 Tax=Alkalibacillus haloalkaliphilus TaxID=94136 RepID=A0A511W8T0_9BACI|nr:hypothetical protein [Alkalibacillus haloalkaliphilus]GEN46758.1 hypothetical protein AHA02nite_25340 [Alkalibacillus haloalkaliphilus]